MRKTLSKAYKSPKTLIIVDSENNIAFKYKHITHIYSEYYSHSKDYSIHFFNVVQPIVNFSVNSLKKNNLKIIFLPETN